MESTEDTEFLLAISPNLVNSGNMRPEGEILAEEGAKNAMFQLV
jgi:hypothetical protein